MGLNTTYPQDYIVIADIPANIVFGTCMLGDEFGKVKSCGLKRNADQEVIKKANTQGILAIILTNPKFELSLDTQFTADTEPPGIGDPIDFPLAGVTGRVLDIDVKWEENGHRGMTISATSWDTLGSDGAGTLALVNPA
jgi:hypothetical protein